ncbi:hypothetical protein OAH18_01500 [bacterium]|nr:hypothetical protein [bacterium]
MPVFFDWLVDANIEPPPDFETLHPSHWLKWWEQASVAWSDAQHVAFWKPFSQVEIFYIDQVGLAE